MGKKGELLWSAAHSLQSSWERVDGFLGPLFLSPPLATFKLKSVRVQDSTQFSETCGSLG